MRTRLKRPKPRKRRFSGGGVAVGGPRKNTSLKAGILGTIIVHVLIIWLGPAFADRFMHGETPIYQESAPAEQLFDIEMMPLPPPPPDTFVDANPDAPDNPPDESENFSDRNQQLAQEVAAEELGDMPSTEGEDDIESTSIVSGPKIFAAKVRRVSGPMWWSFPKTPKRTSMSQSRA